MTAWASTIAPGEAESWSAARAAQRTMEEDEGSSVAVAQHGGQGRLGYVERVAQAEAERHASSQVIVSRQ